MSGRWDSRALLEPIGGESPCGQSLDESQVLSFDAYRVFGQQMPLDAPLDKDEQGRIREQGRTPKPPNSPEWLEIRDRASELMGKSKDLRILAFLAAALVRTDGLAAFCQVVTIASRWLSDYWDTLHPLATEDTMARQSALGCFCDRFAVVDAIRRAPLVTSRRHGQVSLRDLESGAGQAQADAAFDELSLEELQAFHQTVADALAALKGIEARMREANAESVLSFELLSGQTGQLTRLDRVLRTQLGRRSGAAPGTASPEPDAGAVVSAAAGPPSGGVGPIRTRQDAIRALDAVAAFFQQTEPSSPVPLLLERAKRLVAKSFLEVLADIAPGALGEARVASGVKSQ